MTETGEYYDPPILQPIERRSEDVLRSLPPEEVIAFALEMQERAIAGFSIASSVARLQKETQEEVEAMEIEAELEPLTGLLNKKTWLDRIETFLEAQETDFGIIFIDLSHFKNINDTLGHPAGDDVLRKTAELLDTCLREGDKLTHDLGRYGGDEFAILCDLEARTDTSLSYEERLDKIIVRIRQSFAAMIKKEGLDALHLDAAIGGAVYEQGDTVEELLKRADKNMYADKFARRNKLSKEEVDILKIAMPILEKAGLRLPEEIVEKDE